MITAEEARKKIAKKNEEERKKYEEAINKAIDKGESECRIQASLSKQDRSWLKSLGYKVTPNSSQHDGPETIVSW